MRRLSPLLALIITAVPLLGTNSARDLSDRLRAAGLDSEACYRVRELVLAKEDARLFFTEGYLIFGTPVDGRRHSALFYGQIDGGDGEILVMPPTRGERLSLATFTDSPNLDEHFRFALMIFSDNTAEELMERVRAQPRLRQSPERGLLLASEWSEAVGNLTDSFGSRLVFDILDNRPSSEGFFYAAINGVRHGNFDMVYDPTGEEQVQVGQVRFREARPVFNVWTSFRARAFRNGTREAPEIGFGLSDYRIDATLGYDLKITAQTEATLTVADRPRRVFFFDISPNVKVDEITIDGVPCEIWQREALRANLFGGDTGLFLVVAPTALEPGKHTIQFHHQGTVVMQAGNGVYFVGDRNSWYPRSQTGFSHFDVTFRYPSAIDLIFTGKVVEDRTEGGQRITRRRTENPIRLMGFNLGEYESVRTERDGFAIEVYANKRVEQALEPEQRMVLMPDPRQLPRQRWNMPALVPTLKAESPPDPTARLNELAGEVADDFEFMRDHFGPPPNETLMVSPIPGAFGQGFPGLLYLSTVSYLTPEQRPKDAQQGYNETFFSEILHAHETAHQWWGNIVSCTGYQDEWLMEALANYSALMLLEQRRGEEALQTVLSQYREHLVEEGDDGKPLDSAGPIIWGRRLDSSRATAYHTITYEKGSWILHMLRRRLGDEAFLKAIGDLCRQYRYQSLSLEQFREHLAQYTPQDLPDRTLVNFFDQWVYDTGIPTLNVSERIRGSAPKVRVTVTITQSRVPDYFTTLVPVELRFAGGRVVRRWVQTGEQPATLDVTVAERPETIVCNPGDAALAVMR